MKKTDLNVSPAMDKSLACPSTAVPLTLHGLNDGVHRRVETFE